MPLILALGSQISFLVLTGYNIIYLELWQTVLCVLCIGVEVS